MSGSTNKSLQQYGAWCGFLAVLVFFIGMVVMTFLPPIAPNLTPEQVAEVYRQHTFGIRLGALLIIISAFFCGPFNAAIYLQLRRMEGKQRPIGSMGQLASGVANTIFFILPGLLWEVAAFRPDRPPEILSALNDLAWIVAVVPWTVGASQCVCIGWAVLTHGTSSSPYPRWVGFFNIWLAVGMITSSVVPFFLSGPFSWNGIIGFWIPATVFGLWWLVMWWMTLKAIGTDDGQ